MYHTECFLAEFFNLHTICALLVALSVLRNYAFTMRERIETTHEVIKRKLIVFKRANSDKWQCRYKIKDEWIRCSTNEYTLESAIQSANMILIEAHVRDKLNIAPVSKKFKDVAKLAIQRLKEQWCRDWSNEK